jgi:hypothetical protein
MSSLGQRMDIEAIGAAQLAWEMAMLAQSSAYLAEDAQIWAQNSADRTLTLPESTYRRLLDSIGTLSRLLDCMHRSVRRINEGEAPNAICVVSEPLVEEIRYMLGRGLALTLVECMTSTESQKTSNTGDAGDTR